MNVRRMPMSNLNDIFFTPAANQELTYDQVLEDVQRYFAENHASTIDDEYLTDIRAKDSFTV